MEKLTFGIEGSLDLINNVGSSLNYFSTVIVNSDSLNSVTSLQSILDYIMQEGKRFADGISDEYSIIKEFLDKIFSN